MTLTWVLFAVASADLVHGLSGRLSPTFRVRGLAAAAATSIVLAILLEAEAADAGRVAVVAIVTVGLWHGLRAAGRHALAVGWLASALSAALLVGERGQLSQPGNHWRSVWRDVDLGSLSSLHADEVLRLIALSLFLTVTANAVVRLILDLEGAQPVDARDADQAIKGGRIIGPIERLIIFGAVVGGAAATAGLVVAAKSLLRFPELSGDGTDLHIKTEYVLVGSLASWSQALLAAVLV